jgi:hypothetical protein
MMRAASHTGKFKGESGCMRTLDMGRGEGQRKYDDDSSVCAASSATASRRISPDSCAALSTPPTTLMLYSKELVG